LSASGTKRRSPYISKSIAFWLIGVPFFAAGVGFALVQSLFLLLVNGLYVACAITEERHLARVRIAGVTRSSFGRTESRPGSIGRATESRNYHASEG
jgi:hypothetical protein